VSETKKQRPYLEEAHQYACEGDTIVVRRLDQLGHNMQDLIQIEYSLNELGIGFHSLPENLTIGKSNATGWRWPNLKTVFEIEDGEPSLHIERCGG
jgi:DNA invertase Pin-like site-specific DNA recombinase